MNEIGHIERLEVMMTDLYGSILAQLKRKLKESDSQKAVTNQK